MRDNAFLFSVEGRVPLWRTSTGMDIVQFPVFVDVGRGWDVEIDTPPPETLASIGLGLRVAFLRYGQFNIYKGFQLNHVPKIGNNLQDDGIHLNFVVELLELVNLLN